MKVGDRDFLDDYFNRYRQALEPAGVHEQMLAMRDRVILAHQAGRKIMFAGNGASATIASHCALDYSKQGRVRSMSFNDPGLITCLANDCGYENWIRRAMDLYADRGDILVLISASGKSPNVLEAASRAREFDDTVISFTGFDSNNPLRRMSDLAFWVDSRAYNVIESVHHIWLLGVCDLLIGDCEYSVAWPVHRSHEKL